jgi:hypothetical protein
MSAQNKPSSVCTATDASAVPCLPDKAQAAPKTLGTARNPLTRAQIYFAPEGRQLIKRESLNVRMTMEKLRLLIFKRKAVEMGFSA